MNGNHIRSHDQPDADRRTRIGQWMLLIAASIPVLFVVAFSFALFLMATR